MENIIDIIQKHSLTVRCLPHEVITCWNYKEGDENKKYVDSNGKPIEVKREVIIQNFDLEYFQKTIYLLGQDEYGINYWLESPSWD